MIIHCFASGYVLKLRTPVFKYNIQYWRFRLRVKNISDAVSPMLAACAIGILLNDLERYVIRRKHRRQRSTVDNAVVTQW